MYVSKPLIHENIVFIFFFLQVDGPYAAVKFPPKDSAIQGAAASGSNEETGSLLQDVRLLRKDELQVILADYLSFQFV